MACRCWKRAHDMLMCCLHLALGSTIEIRMSLSQCCLKMVLSTSSSSLRKQEFLRMAIEHATLALEQSKDDPMALLCLVHAKMCSGLEHSCIPHVSHIMRCQGIFEDQLLDIFQLSRQAGLETLAYHIATAILFKNSQLASHNTKHCDSHAFNKRLRCYLQVLESGIRILGKAAWMKVPTMYSLMQVASSQILLDCDIPQDPCSVLAVLVDHVSSLESLIDNMLHNGTQVRFSFCMRTHMP
jgi:hypothetical protein